MKEGKFCDLTIIVASLNAAETLPATLASVAEAQETLATEVIVVDGGSNDETRARAAAAGADVIESPRGRGRQLAAGAKAANGRWLLFLHADTALERFWSPAANTFMNLQSNVLHAGYFKLALADAAREARRVERLANWRARTFGLPYGDQGLLVSRTLYDSVGGFSDIPLMEDVDLVRRIGKARLAELPATATTSALRYKRDGYILRPLRNLSILGLYLLGVPPQQLVRLYG
ncbi:MAG: glycosyltransferase [Alphaproteobacteria bacterium]|nr:glycosyltransferase [Alphaproteobacteria bacterium]